MLLGVSPQDTQAGYCEKGKTVVLQPFFATANAGFRREVFQELGGFDASCITGEDMDLSFRVLSSRWRLFREPRCRVEHRYRETLKELLRQWFWYGYGHPYVFKKHSPKGVQILLRRWRKPKEEAATAYRYLGRVRLPIFGYFFVGSFHLFNFLMLASIVLFRQGPLAQHLAYLSAGLAAIFGLNYVLAGFKRTQPLQSMIYVGLRYLVSVAFSLGGLVGGLKNGVFCLEDAFESNPK